MKKRQKKLERNHQITVIIMDYNDKLSFDLPR